jgi:DNA-binding CsgD family transcriptional regulator
MEAPRGQVVGRKTERAALSQFVKDLGRRPRDLVLEGEPGIGKTTLWRTGLEKARRAGHRVLVTRPGENETRLSHAGIGDLLGDVFDEALADAPRPQRRALEIVLLRREPVRSGPDHLAISLGLLAAFRKLSAASPVVIAVDDIQWLDQSSASALSFAVRRLTTDPVAILATRRLERGSAGLVDLTEVIKARDIVRLHVGPLGQDDVAQILRERMHRPITPPLAVRVHEAARGNPFFSLEIAATLGDAEPAAGLPLRVPADVHDVLRKRVDHLSANARDVTLVVSAMARPTLGDLRLARPNRDKTDAGLTEAEEAELLVLDGERIDFTHPLLSSTSYWSTSQAKRRAVHARLAQVVPNLEERARQIALTGTGPDQSGASLVEEAADHARRRGAALAAAELLELSAKLTPLDDETNRCRRTRDAALNRFDAGDVGRGRVMLETLIAETSSRQQQAVTRAELAFRAYNDVGRVHELLRAALGDIGDHSILPVIHANLAWVALCRLEPAIAADHARAAIELAQHVSEVTPLRLALGALGEAEALLGLDPVPTMRRAAAIGAEPSPGESVLPERLRGEQLLWQGRIAEARRSIREADLKLVDAGLELMRHDTLPSLTEVECAAGDWTAASRHADEGYDIVAYAGLDEMRDQMLHARAHVAALLGHVEDARRDATEGAALAVAYGNRWTEVGNRSVLGFVALSVGDPAEAVRALETADQLLANSGIVEPGAFPFVPDLVEALVTTGKFERAKRLADRLQAEGATLDRALALATAARCRALIAAGLGDPPGALLELELAFQQHERIAMPFEFARTLLIHGDTVRRMKRKREARDALERARSQFEALGARLWQARAEESLSRIGGRSASPTELTETERRVADAVADGLTNKEAAARLFMSVKTVESNLRRVYRKLNVRSRTELARQHRIAPTWLSESSPSDQT